MRLDPQKAFAHPVLREQIGPFADYKGAQIQAQIDLTQENGKYYVKFRVQQSVPEIDNLILSGQARVLLAIDCRRTSISFNSLFSDKHGQISVSIDDLEGDVFFQVSIVVVVDKISFTSTKLNSEFGDKSFTLLKGDPLAIAPATYWAFTRDDQRPIAHLFEATQNSKLKKSQWRSDLSGDKVIIELGNDVYESFNKMKGSKQGQALLYNTFLVPIMVEMLAQLREDEETTTETRWGRVLHQRLPVIGCGSLESASLTQIAQDIWNLPGQYLPKLQESIE